MNTSRAVAVSESASSPTDDSVHFNQAAKALGVSRKTVERMVKKNELERVPRPDGAPVALITKRSLVAELERRRGAPVDPVRLAQAVARPSVPDAAGRDLRELVEPLLQQVIDARTRAAELEIHMRLLEERTGSREQDQLLAREQARSREDDPLMLAIGRAAAALEAQEETSRRQGEMLAALISGSWMARRRARREAVAVLATR